MHAVHIHIYIHTYIFRDLALHGCGGCFNSPCTVIVFARVWQTFSVKGQIINILGFARYMAPVATTQHCQLSTTEALNNS